MFPNARLCRVLIGTRHNFRWCGLVAEHPRDGTLVCHFHVRYEGRLPLIPDHLPFYARRRLVVRR